MLDKCKTAILAKAKEIGREGLKDSDLKAIDDRLNKTMKLLARQDPQAWMQTPLSMRVSLAAEKVLEDIGAEADRKVANAEKQILASSQVDSEIGRMQSSFKGARGHDGTRSESLKEHFDQTDQYIKSVRRESSGQLMDTIQAAGNKQGASFGRKILMTLFDAENPLMTRDMALELFAKADGSTGNKIAQAGARAWLDTAESLRQRFNAAGGDIRQLAYGYIPQKWSVSKVAKQRDAFAEMLLPHVDRRMYLHEDGTRMSDQEVLDFLTEASQSIISDGQNKRAPGEYQGSGKRANRGQDERQIHFKDGLSYIAVMQQFGEGSMFEAMMGHIGGVSRDIGLVERYGPDPSAQAKLQFDLASRADEKPIDDLVGVTQINPQTYWKIISGETGLPVSEPLARWASTVRNIMTAAKLGSALLTSFADLGTLAVTTGYNKLSYWQLAKDIGIQAKNHAEARDFMAAHGMMAESLEHALDRWSGDQLSGSWSGKMGNSVMKWSLLNAWTDGLRQGFKMTHNAALMRMAGKGWMALEDADRTHLIRSGFSEADWATMNKVAPTLFRGRELLTPDAIRATGDKGAEGLATRMLAFVQDESEYAIVSPDLKTRAITTFGGQSAGTVSGELARSVMQFKSFPIAMLTRHWARAMEGDAMNRTLYGFALMTTLTGLGAITVQSKQILSGQDPIDMTKGRFWAKAVATGGAWGIAGDLFLVDPQSNGADAAGTFAKNALGPALGSVAELALKIGVENAWQAAEGKDTHLPAELANWVKGNTPGASLWWLKPAMEHGFMAQMNESMSPGYLSRVKQRAMQNWGTRYWWSPEQLEPSREPDFAAAVGQ